MEQKLGSRKFWTLIGTFVANVLLLFAVQPEIIVQVCAVISSMGVAIAYIIGEAKVDAARVAKPTLE